MEINPQTTQNVEIGIEKGITIRKALNIYGVFAALALIGSIFTTPISINENMQLFFNEDVMMEPKKIKGFFLFIFGSAFVYFSLVNLYYKNI